MQSFAENYTLEYGAELSVASAIRHCTWLPRAKEIRSAAHYRGACKRLASKMGVDLSVIDSRIVAAGYNIVGPRRWIDGELDDFAEYVRRAAARPDVIGSPYNIDIDVMAQYWRFGIRPGAIRALGLARKQGIFDWDRSCPLPVPLFGLMADLSCGRSPKNIGRDLAKRKRKLYRIARAVGRCSILSPQRDGEGFCYAVQWSPKVLATMGRVSPELQQAIVTCTLRRLPEDVRLVMPRHIPWDDVAKIHRDMQQCERVRVAWMTGKRLAHHATGLASALAPAYPRVSLPLQAAITRGATPVDLAGGDLSPKEAHEWLASGARVSAVEYAIVWHSLAVRKAVGEFCVLRSLVVARWARSTCERGQVDQLTRIRTARGPDGEVVFRFLDKIDEIADEDIVNGVNTTPKQAFEAAAARAGAVYQNKMLGDHRRIASEPKHWRRFRCMRLLDTPAKLAAEGSIMRHCVGTYAPMVERGDSLIYSIDVLGHRSTVELSPTGRVRQHYGERNSRPHPLCERVLDKFVDRIRNEPSITRSSISSCAVA